MGTLRFAEDTNHNRKVAKDAQIAGTMMNIVFITFFTLCIFVRYVYNMSLLGHIIKQSI